ncbi:MAG: 50S ribosomal protein L6 [Candidatus Omnitrophica bacterium]|nr:50S ribosomal protein L6 [Candidatus Omnitrophota bacterium]
MSRIGKIPVQVLKDAKITINKSDILVEGPKGKLSLPLPPKIVVKQDKDVLVVTRLGEDKQTRANHGTIRARLKAMIIGVTKGHRKDLEIQGVGFRAAQAGNKITFNLGLSHPIEFVVPADVKATVTSQTQISIEGADIIKVGQAAAEIRAFKPAEPYKAKGVRYVGEVIRRKQGKSAGKK